MAKSLETIFASAARTATPTAVDLQVSHASGITLVIDTTAINLTPSVVFTVLGLDPISGKTWTLLASAAVTAVSTVVLDIWPGATAAANLAANKRLPQSIRVTAVHADADSITYSVTAHLLD